MLKQILQMLLFCFVVVILTTKMTFSSPFPSSIDVATHLPDHEISVPSEALKPNAQPVAQPGEASQTEPLNSEQADSESRRSKSQADTQASPSAPYDPYDYDAIREMNRQIYGEVKDLTP